MFSAPKLKSLTKYTSFLLGTKQDLMLLEAAVTFGMF